MSDLRKAAQQALEALEMEATSPPIPETAAAITALRAALAQPEQEPVAWGIVASNTGKVCQVELDREYVLGHNPAHVVPLYTAPSQRKPLTEAVIVITLRDAGYSIITNQETETAVRVFRIAERAHGIGDEK